MKLPDRVSAIVFDCDGLQVDTEPAWTAGETALFADHGLEFGPEQKRMVIGKSISGASDAMGEYFGQPGCPRANGGTTPTDREVLDRGLRVTAT
jgi:beta-phosphoglucomutase-like phosphatase (HAD superfamily)